MLLEYIDFLHLSKIAFGKSLKTALGYHFGLMRNTHPGVGVPTCHLAETDNALKRVFETRAQGGWPIVAYGPDPQATYTVSYERGNPHNMYRMGRYGGTMARDLATYTKVKLIPVDVPYIVGFLTDKTEEMSAFISAWSVMAHTSGLKFNEFFDSIGLNVPISVSLDTSIATSNNEDSEVPYRKAVVSATVKTYVGYAQMVPSVLGTRRLLDAALELGADAPQNNQSPIFRDVSSL